MSTEYYEIIKISDFKEREIEAYYINPDLSEIDKLTYIMKKGSLNQKISFACNLEFYLTDQNSINAFFDLLKEKMLDFEMEFQHQIIETLIKFYTIPYEEILKFINKEHIHSLLVLIIQIVTDDEKSKKNDIYIRLFHQIVEYYKDAKINLDPDFITFVVNLASFGKSNYSRMYSVIFCTGFAKMIDQHNTEIIDRFFRSATDLEKCVRVAISSGFSVLAGYIGNNEVLLSKILQLVSYYINKIID
jgi:hypothetical protein